MPLATIPILLAPFVAAAAYFVGRALRRWYRRTRLRRIPCRACRKAEMIRPDPHDAYRWRCEGCGQERDINRPRLPEHQGFETWRAGQTFSTEDDARKAYERWHGGQNT